MLKRLRSAHGFTLIELLVVITIIGILTAAGLVFFAQAQKTARDAKREEDVKAIGRASEQYFAANGQYPTSSSQIPGTYFPGGQLPVDSNQNPYTYTADYGGAAAIPGNYCVCSKLENATKGNANGLAAGAGGCPFSTPGAGYFCEQNQQ